MQFLRTLAPMLLALTGCSQADPAYQISGSIMGTTYSISIADCATVDCAEIGAEVAARLTDLTGKLSHYDPESELTAFNERSDTDWFPVSADLGNVVTYALQVSEASDGAFDITIAPAVNAWGFGPANNRRFVPTAPVIDAARQHSGFRKLETRAEPISIRKLDAKLQLDLSALAKGYAVDQLALLLEKRGSKNYLVEIGGELRTAGLRNDGKPWRIGIQPPAGGQEIEFAVAPGNGAVATSGDYQNFYLVDGRRISHTIDPATARPVQSGLASVTVIAPATMQADAWATALMVMGPQAGPEFARENELAALFLVRTEAGMRANQSPAFAAYRLQN